jgi:hypothetical protein
MSFAHSIALLMIVRSEIVILELQLFSGIYLTLVLGVSLRKVHLFHITVLKIIYVHDTDTCSIYETYTISM